MRSSFYYRHYVFDFTILYMNLGFEKKQLQNLFY